MLGVILVIRPKPCPSLMLHYLLQSARITSIDNVGIDSPVDSRIDGIVYLGAE